MTQHAVTVMELHSQIYEYITIRKTKQNKEVFRGPLLGNQMQLVVV